jgi:hypothetical protein
VVTQEIDALRNPGRTHAQMDVGHEQRPYVPDLPRCFAVGHPIPIPPQRDRDLIPIRSDKK